MKTIFVLGVLFILELFIHCGTCQLGDNALKKLLVIYRHGDRAPAFEPFPTDPNRNYKWPDGMNNLTTLGKNQGLELGKYLGQKYRSFISPNTNEVFARSSSYLRCIQTTGCVLTGIYSPGNTDNCFKNTGFTASPIYTVNPGTYDHMLYPDPNCPKYSLLLQQYATSSEFRQLMAPYQGLVTQLKNLTGLPNLSIMEVVNIYDTLVVEAAHNLTIPSWAPALMPEMSKVTFLIYDALSKLEEIGKLQTGFLLNDILMRMNENKETNQKLYLYGTHDTLVLGISKLMRVSNGLLPPYAAALIIEVRRQSLLVLNYDYVKIYYRNSSSVDPYEMTIRGCSSMCSVTDFIRLTEKSAVQDPQAACSVSLG